VGDLPTFVKKFKAAAQRVTYESSVEFSRQLWSMLHDPTRLESPGIEQELIAAAERMRAKDHLEPAAAVLQAALHLRPDSANVHQQSASIFQQMGAFEPAIETFNTAYRLDPIAFRNHAIVGWCLQQLNRKTEAIAAFRQALQHRPSDFASHMNLALLYMDFGKMDEAAWLLKNAASIKPRGAKERRAATSNRGLTSSGRRGVHCVSRRSVVCATDYAVITVMAADKEVARLALLLSTRHVARHDYAADLRVPGFLLESQQREAQVRTSSSCVL
jgi:tetratricopeptide (TPR) repeat protein